MVCLVLWVVSCCLMFDVCRVLIVALGCDLFDTRFPAGCRSRFVDLVVVHGRCG